MRCTIPAAQNAARSPIVALDNPKGAYTSDALAAKLNDMADALSEGYALDIALKEDFAPGGHGYDEARFAATIKTGGKPAMVVDYSYETRYDKFHEKKVTVP